MRQLNVSDFLKEDTIGITIDGKFVLREDLTVLRFDEHGDYLLRLDNAKRYEMWQGFSDGKFAECYVGPWNISMILKDFQFTEHTEVPEWTKTHYKDGWDKAHQEENKKPPVLKAGTGGSLSGE